MKRITVLGSTGSIGTQTLDVVSMHPDQFAVEALAGGSNIKLLAEQAHLYQPKKVSVGTKQLAEEIRPLLPSGMELHWGG